MRISAPAISTVSPVIGPSAAGRLADCGQIRFERVYWSSLLRLTAEMTTQTMWAVLLLGLSLADMQQTVTAETEYFPGN